MVSGDGWTEVDDKVETAGPDGVAAVGAAGRAGPVVVVTVVDVTVVGAFGGGELPVRGKTTPAPLAAAVAAAGPLAGAAAPSPGTATVTTTASDVMSGVGGVVIATVDDDAKSELDVDRPSAGALVGATTGGEARFPGFDHTERVVTSPGLAKRASRTANTDAPAHVPVSTHTSVTGKV